MGNKKKIVIFWQLSPGLWIRIVLMRIRSRIRIQLKILMRIRIQIQVGGGGGGGKVSQKKFLGTPQKY